MIEYNAANHDYSVTAGSSGAMFSSAARSAPRPERQDLPVSGLHGHPANFPPV